MLNIVVSAYHQLLQLHKGCDLKWMPQFDQLYLSNDKSLVNKTYIKWKGKKWYFQKLVLSWHYKCANPSDVIITNFLINKQKIFPTIGINFIQSSFAMKKKV